VVTGWFVVGLVAVVSEPADDLGVAVVEVVAGAAVELVPHAAVVKAAARATAARIGRRVIASPR
jgi:hypothetical protein